jgi:radical SAM protein with 4Fe4S-binding SPASM domain
VTHTLAEQLGVAGEPSPGPMRPLEVHMAVTARCPASCAGCYIDARPEGEHPDLDVLRTRLEAVARAGASTVAFGGGEPLTRKDLGAIARIARSLSLVPVLTTSGIGLTEERTEELRDFAQINVSHDGIGEAYAAVRGYEGAEGAERAIRLLVAAGIPTGANLVLTRASFPALEASVEHLADLGVREVQILRYKPAGRAATLTYVDRRLTPAQVAELWPLLERIGKKARVSLRIDCAMVPLLAPSLASLDDGPARLERFGVFGCEAGRHLGSLTVKGSASPCSFSPPSGGEPLPIDEAWSSGDELERFRAYHADLPEPCGSCSLRRVCRGGCQVVSRFASGGDFAPDPECPRVRSHAAQAAAAP